MRMVLIRWHGPVSTEEPPFLMRNHPKSCEVHLKTAPGAAETFGRRTMRILTVVLLTCLSIALGSGPGEPVASAPAESTASRETLRVFFIGNSHTGCNNLLKVVKTLSAESQAGPDMVTAGHIVGGCTLERHWHADRALAKMKQGKWDIVVLQENGQGPLAYPDKMRQYARRFDREIKEAGARTLLFMTAAYQDHPETTGTIVKAHLEIGSELKADVSPVGLAFENALRKRPDLTLHNLPDTVHANHRGTYLTAAVLWATLTGKNPYGLSRGGLAGLTDDEIAFLQDTAQKSIVEYRAMAHDANQGAM